MQSQKPPTTLGKLEFLEIKQSLVDYLSKQSTFSGYEFEGAALSTLMDLLSYNAYYYAFYSNMIVSEAFLDSAQRVESLISLCKPLGYTIPSKTSSKIKVIATGVSGTSIPRHSLFIGRSSDGIQYRFFNLDDIPATQSNTGEFYIYEGKSLVFIEVINQIDLERQRVVIADLDFDLETLQVEVENPVNPGTYEIWSRVNNVGYSNTIEEKIYFVERIETGFIISFGLVNSVGKNITEDVKSVKVRYLKSSGSKGNGISLFSSAICNVVTNPGSATEGGKDDPSNETVKFLAPKWFASQERAVTVNDYKALILEAGFFESQNQFNIYGGEDIFPRRYGRVFITSQKPISDVADLMQFIKERSVITILPEYVSSSLLNVYFDFSFSFSDGIFRTASQKQEIANGIKNLFESNYSKTREYNLYFSCSDFINAVQTLYPNIVTISLDDCALYVEQTVDARISDYNFNLENELDIPTGLKTVLSTPFISTVPQASNITVSYVGEPTVANQLEVPLKLYNSSNLAISYPGAYGTIYPVTGIINIKSKIMNEPAIFKIPFKKKTIRLGLNNLITFAIKNITIL